MLAQAREIVAAVERLMPRTLLGRSIIIIVTPVMLVYAFSSNFAYALAGSLLRKWLAHGRRLLWFNRTMAAVLVLTAGWMASV